MCRTHTFTFRKSHPVHSFKLQVLFIFLELYKLLRELLKQLLWDTTATTLF